MIAPAEIRLGRLISLWELFAAMKPFDVTSFLAIATATGAHKMYLVVGDMHLLVSDAITAATAVPRKKQEKLCDRLLANGAVFNLPSASTRKIPEVPVELMKSTFQEVKNACEEIGLDASEDTLERIIALLGKNDATWGEYIKLLDELEGRLRAQMGRRTFFSLTSQEAHCYSRAQEGWETVVKAFPAATSDIEEARKCFALGRYAASVFHSLQIVEVGVIALGKCLGCRDYQEGWSATTNAIQAIIRKKHADRTEFEKANFQFIEQMNGTIEALKNAWRNKVTHVHGKPVVMTADFSPDVAEDILSATRAFMRRIATEAPWPVEAQPS